MVVLIQGNVIIHGLHLDVLIMIVKIMYILIVIILYILIVIILKKKQCKYCLRQ
jgi:hypothetical protein